MGNRQNIFLTDTKDVEKDDAVEAAQPDNQQAGEQVAVAQVHHEEEAEEGEGQAEGAEGGEEEDQEEQEDQGKEDKEEEDEDDEDDDIDDLIASGHIKLKVSFKRVTHRSQAGKGAAPSGKRVIKLDCIFVVDIA